MAQVWCWCGADLGRLDMEREAAAAGAAEQQQRGQLLEEQRAAAGEARVRSALQRISEQRRAPPGTFASASAGVAPDLVCNIVVSSMSAGLNEVYIVR